MDEGPPERPYENPMLVHLFTQCRLIERILEAWEEDDLDRAQLPASRGRGSRRGYMGHLTKVANLLVTLPQRTRPAPPCSAKVIVEQMKALPEATRESWAAFVSGRLSEVNKRNTIVPASSYASAMHDSSEDDDAEFRNLQFPQEVALQHEVFDHLMKRMSYRKQKRWWNAYMLFYTRNDY